MVKINHIHQPKLLQKKIMGITQNDKILELKEELKQMNQYLYLLIILKNIKILIKK